jgi:hypothetical protein
MLSSRKSFRVRTIHEVTEMVQLPRALRIANIGGALLSMGSCVLGLINPGITLPHGSAVTAGVEFYALAYAARALPLGAALIQQLLWSRTGRGLLPLLVVSGAVQLADSAIGAADHNPGMTFGAGLLAALHLASAARLARRETAVA